jgi:peptidyl-tRNA hydrolase
MSVKQVIVVRRDLRLRRAELAALIAKTSLQFFVDNDESERSDALEIRLSPVESVWLSGGGTSVTVLGVPTRSSLEALLFKAEEAGISSYAVYQSRREDPDDEKSPVVDQVVCIALGPDESTAIDKITGRLKLL